MECEEVHMKPVRLQQEEVLSMGVVNLQPAEGGGGKDGVGIASIEQIEASVESGGVNVIKVTLTNGLSAVFEVRNGLQGERGTDGHTPVITSHTISEGVQILSDGVVIGTIPVGGNGVATSIEDNLTSDRTDAALSAKQGKNLKAELDTLGIEVNEVYWEVNGSSKDYDSSILKYDGYCHKDTGIANTNNTYSHSDFIPVYEGLKVILTLSIDNLNVGVICAYSNANESSFLEALAATSAGYDKVFTYIVPSSVKYIRVSCQNKYLPEREYRLQIISSKKSLKDELKDLSNSVSETEDAVKEVSKSLYKESTEPPSELPTWVQHYIGTKTGNIRDNVPTYNLLLFNTEEGEEYIINGSGQVGDAKVYCVYNTEVKEDFSEATAVECSQTLVRDQIYPLRVKIPQGGKILAVSIYTGGNISVKRVSYKNRIDDFEQERKCIQYSLLDNKIFVGYNSGDKQLVVSLYPSGGNGLFDFRRFYTLDIGEDIDETKLTQIHSNHSSDWFAPFKMRAVNNIDGDDYGNPVGDEYFTGGAHQYNNLQSGSTPTARLESVDFYIDGQNITSGSGRCSYVKIKWTNFIQAYNTRKADGSGREVLKEIITLTFDGVKWDAETELIPLEDIKLDLWYGYQTTGITETMAAHWRFIGAVNRLPDASNSGNKNCQGFEGYGGACNVRCILDTTYDMGDRNQVHDNATNGAFKSGTKMYFTIANKWQQLNANESYFLKGTYYISRP